MFLSFSFFGALGHEDHNMSISRKMETLWRLSIMKVAWGLVRCKGLGFFDESETTSGGNGIFMKKIEKEEDWCFKSLSLEKDKDIDESSVEMAEDVLSGAFSSEENFGFLSIRGMKLYT